MFPLLLLELKAEQLILDVENLLIQSVKTLEYNSISKLKRFLFGFFDIVAKHKRFGKP
jgi:hypothetical protein